MGLYSLSDIGRFYCRFDCKVCLVLAGFTVYGTVKSVWIRQVLL